VARKKEGGGGSSCSSSSVERARSRKRPKQSVERALFGRPLAEEKEEEKEEKE
jgi:hypothetical protein